MTCTQARRTGRSRSSIRRSREEDIVAIRAWLEAEDAAGVHGNFLCNWSVIERAHHDRELLVYVDGLSGLPVAFQLGRLLTSGILQVKHEFRGRGIGTKLVEYCVRLAHRKGESVLAIQCKPSTSIPFWERMGFKLVPGSDPSNCAYRVLERMHAVPELGPDLKVVVRFFPESRKWKQDVTPYEQTTVSAKRLADGSIQLVRRVSFPEDAYPEVRDVVVEVEIDGVQQFCDKAKYDEVQARGVQRCRNGWFIDVIRPK